MALFGKGIDPQTEHISFPRYQEPRFPNQLYSPIELI